MGHVESKIIKGTKIYIEHFSNILELFNINVVENDLATLILNNLFS